MSGISCILLAGEAWEMYSLYKFFSLEWGGELLGS